MARGGIIVVGAALVAIAGLAFLASDAAADELDPRVPPPPKPPTGGNNAMALAKAHPLYAQWLNAAQQCDKWFAQVAAEGENASETALTNADNWCGAAATIGQQMVNDGVPMGKWR